MYHRRHTHSHPDLPAIPEAAEEASVVSDSLVDVISPTETIPDDENYFNGREQQVEGEDVVDDDDYNHYHTIDHDGEEGSVDDASNAESLANNSCAFSLDNVGFDEESSLGGSHSVVGANHNNHHLTYGLSSVGNDSAGNNISLFETPTSHERSSFDTTGKSTQEQKHRETCRAIGLPYNEDWLDTNYSSSSSDVGSGSFLGSISDSSGSASEVERKRKIDKLWPWPTAAKGSNKKNSVDEIALPFDEESNSSSSSTGSSKSSNVNSKGSMAKIAEAKSICTKNMKDAWASFNERLENVYDKTQSNSTHHQRSGDLNSMESSEQPPSPESDTSRRPSYVPAIWVNRYNESNFRTKVAVWASMILVLLCIIIVPATIGTSQSNEVPSSSLFAEHPVTPSSHSIPSDEHVTITAVASNSVVTATIPPETSTGTTSTAGTVTTKPTESNTVVTTTTATIGAVIVPTESISDAPSTGMPTASPVKVILDLGDTSNSTTNNTSNSTPSCVDMDGKFFNSLGKRRTCYWLSIRAAGELHSTTLDAECGGNGMKPSELGLNCQDTCRGYNGCINESKATDSTNSFANSTTASNGGSGQVNSTTVNATDDDDEIETSHTLQSFIDTRGQVRYCSFLNIRNHNRRAIRRKDNCVREDIRSTCPMYCSDYFTDKNSTAVVDGSQVVVAGSNIRGGGGGTREFEDKEVHKKSSAMEIHQKSPDMEEAKKDLTELDDAMTALSAFRIDDGMKDATSTTEMEEEEDDELVAGKEDGADEDTAITSCIDNTGHYLNHHGRAVQCSWLIDSRDPTDETRRIDNCGYGGISSSNADLPTVTELGKMCRNTCGTCGQ